MKRPASLAFLHDEGQRRAPPSSSATPFSKVESEGGHPRGCPSVSPTGDEDVDVPAGKAQRKSRWAAHVPSVTTLPPQGVDRTSDFLQPYQSDGANKRDATRTSCLPPAAPPVSSTAARPKLQGPLAVKSKAVKPASAQSQVTAEQGLANAIQSRLQAPGVAGRSLVDLAADKPPVKATANPRMPSELAADPASQPSGSTMAATRNQPKGDRGHRSSRH